MENLRGQLIKGYELRERIGAGGFGAVYKAYQSTVEREVAVKIILPHFSNHWNDPEKVESQRRRYTFIGRRTHDRDTTAVHERVQAGSHPAV